VPAGSATVAGFESDLFREYELSNLPRFATGLTLTQRGDDGTPDFQQTYAAAKR
jgi:hypothetical protein